MRIDKWLWAARFFKTRSAASVAISGGKVHLNSERTKPARIVRPGDTLEITRARQCMIVKINALNTQRRPAREAQGLYTETKESLKKRESEAQVRRLLRDMNPTPPRRPNKRERRQIRRFTGKE
ncbi:MAG: RNA-binding protein [Gammaproteobacteria bacterium]|nr:RNA-binding protein [Gammaproteobacteria bacterium]